MKFQLSIFLVLFGIHLFGQNTINENIAPTDPSLPIGISYQQGPGSNNIYNWTYPYGSKITLNINQNRNFEVGTTTYPYGYLVFRQWDATNNIWSTWRKIMMEDNNGNVGIGISNPETKLHVDNGVITSGSTSATYGSLQFVGNYQGNNVLNTYGSQYSTGATSIGYAVKQKNGSSGFVSSAENASFKKGMLLIDGELEFLNASASQNSIDSDVSLTSRFIINENGDVGIGTTNTYGHKLAVDGTAIFEEVQVKMSENWADFVFEPDYNLRTLEETEQFIAKNGHLPDIPSAKQVEKEGISLGEMDAKLLQKIEELTLYMIEMKKENEEKDKKIEDLTLEIKKLKN